MGERRHSWRTTLLFYLTLCCALMLGVLVLAAPLIWEEDENRFLQVFARDSTVRRTALASAVGLAVTAFVFFRPGLLLGKKSRWRRPPPNTMAGA